MKPSRLPASLRNQPFRVRDAVPIVGRNRLRRSDLIVVTRGLRLHRSLRSLTDAQRFAPGLGADQFFSHTTAAGIWGMPVPRGPLHVTTLGSGPIMRRRGVTGHRVARERAQVVTKNGLRVSDAVTSFFESAALTGADEVDADDLVALADWLVGRACGLDLDDLRRIAARSRGRRGVRRIRRALDLARVGSESRRETRLRLRLGRAGFRPPLLNCDVHDADGRFIGRPDIIYGRERVCIEYDGDHHRTDRKTFREDIRRRERFSAAGWHSIHVSDDDLFGSNWDQFVQHAEAALARGRREADARDAARMAPRSQ